jgi:purine catabolism regulator
MLTFPRLGDPPDAEFMALLERLYLEILDEQMALRARADDVHRRLTRLVLEGGDLQAVTDTLATILGRSVLIESPHYEVLTSAIAGPVDENRLRAIELGYTPREVVHRMLKRGIYADLQKKMRPVRLGTMPDIGMTMERIIAPIVVRREIYGYIWIVEGDRPLTDLDELAIDHAATVAALVTLKDQAVHEAQQAARGDFLAQLLRPAGEMDGAAAERAHALGYQFDRPHQALFVIPSAADALAQLSARLDNWLRHQGQRGLVVARERGIALIVESKSGATGQALAEKLLKDLSTPAQALTVGVGHVAAEKSLRRVYDEAVEAADIGLRVKADLVCFWELGLLDWLYHVPPEVSQRNPYLAKIQALAEHDSRSNGELVQTLETYLDRGGALAEAAAALNVHRNTLLYRLGRIEEIADVDLKDVQQRLNLHAALKMYSLRK